uniref:P/Homo B domain-containing protein n=1 Tax=Ditylenchus dipsaci TaxID=166011 RepID=A0A915D2T9_9BILA
MGLLGLYTYNSATSLFNRSILQPPILQPAYSSTGALEDYCPTIICPALTWRDTQHIVLRTANPTPLLNNAGWSINGVGKRISNKFGYGLMDAGALVKLAKVWTTVPEQHMCTYEYSLDSPRPRPIQGRFQLNFSMEVGGCAKGTPVLYLEHVQVITTIRFAKRGDLKLTLFSPMGTQSVLLPPRPQDFNQNGFHKWPFLSVQMWGEDPRGIWTLMVESISTNPQIGGMFSDWTLLLYGTEEPPQPNDPRHGPLSPAQRNHQAVGQQSFGQGTNTQQQVNDNNNLWARFLNLLHRHQVPLPQLIYYKSNYPRKSSFVPATQVEPSFTFGDLKSAGDCHVECLVGCTESRSAAACFSCKHFTQSLRNRAGFKCVEQCEQGFFGDGDKCKKCSLECESCTQAEQCTSCHGALLLVDVPEHYGHQLQHGKCVDNCPEGLVKDYTNLIQAKCVLKKNPCSQGYYQNLQGVCVVCDQACATCHGASPTSCEQCAQAMPITPLAIAGLAVRLTPLLVAMSVRIARIQQPIFNKKVLN